MNLRNRGPSQYIYMYIYEDNNVEIHIDDNSVKKEFFCGCLWIVWETNKWLSTDRIETNIIKIWISIAFSGKYI